MGLLDYLQTPTGMGLLSAVAGGMAGARRGQPINSIGRGLLTGLQGYQGAQDQISKQADNTLDNQMKMMQVEELKRQMEQNKLAPAAMQSAMQSAITPAKSAIPESWNVGGTSYPDAQKADTAASTMFSLPAGAMPGSPLEQPQGIQDVSGGQMAPITHQNAIDSMPGGFDFGKFAQAVMSNPNASPEMKDLAFKYYASQKPVVEKWDQTPHYDQTGQAFILSDQGHKQYLDGVRARDKLVDVNLGGVTGLRTEYSPDMVSTMQHTVTPDAMMTDARTRFEGTMNRAQSERASLRSASNSDATSLFTPAAIENAAARYNVDGTLPPMGMGKNGSIGRSAILNKAAEMAGLDGTSGTDQRVNQLSNKSNASGLTQLVKQQTMVSAFERNAKANAAMALKLSDKVDRTGSPLLNTWMQAGQRNVTGNPELSQFHAANETFVNEYAKIMSGSMGNTVVSDSARTHAHSLLSTVQNKKQYAAVMSTLQQEMDNRMTGFDQEIQAIRDKMRGGKPKGNVVDFGSLK